MLRLRGGEEQKGAEPVQTPAASPPLPSPPEFEAELPPPSFVPRLKAHFPLEKDPVLYHAFSQLPPPGLLSSTGFRPKKKHPAVVNASRNVFFCSLRIPLSA